MFKLSNKENIDFTKLCKIWSSNLLYKIPFFKRRFKKQRRKKLLKIILYIVFYIFLFLAIILGTQFLNIKDLYRESKLGKNNIENAVEQTVKQNFKKSIFFSDSAQNNFKKAQESNKKIKENFFISHIPYINTQFDNIEYLLITSEMLSRAVNQGADLAQGLEDTLDSDKKLSFSKFSKAEKIKLLKKVYESSPEFIDIKDSLDLALFNLNYIQSNKIPWFIRSKIVDLEKKIEFGQSILEISIPLSQVLPALAGYPEESTYLVVLQNSDELRATGGFIGTYGILESEYGNILRFETHDIYHLDMPVKDLISIEPPAPIKKYLNVQKWYMRDANWSPDWPTAARKIQWFFDKEDSLLSPKDQVNNLDKNFDGVIAITPKLVTDFLEITGPIFIDGEEYNSDNFVDLLEYKVERGYIQLGTSKWHRKEIVGDIFKKLKIKLLDSPSSRWKEIARVIEKNFVKKNLLFYFNNTELQAIVHNMGWTGELKEVDGDYVMVVDSNMAALKTDAVMNRSINYKVEQKGNGLFAKLKINYIHNGDFDWKTTRYRTYTRVYVPEGSKLIRVAGQTDKKIEIYNELGKTVFGAFISIEPGRVGSLLFEYKLPDRLNKEAKNRLYKLYFQKQPGNDIDTLAIDVKTINAIKSYSPTGFYVYKINNNQIQWNSDLITDKNFKMILNN